MTGYYRKYKGQTYIYCLDGLIFLIFAKMFCRKIFEGGFTVSSRIDMAQKIL